jgi:hypothetical protein
MNTSDIREHMEVVGSCGNHVGAVDRILGRWIKLTRHDYMANGQHHYIPLDWIASVDDKVRLDRACDEAVEHWHTEPVGAEG